MLTRRSYFPPASTIPRRSRKQTTNVVEPEFRTIVTMANNRTMAQMLQAPIEGYEDAIIFTGRQDPHNHLCFFNKVTSTFRHPEVPNTTIKLLLFPFSLEGEARIWLDKEPPRSILTWEDLVLKFINQFFPPSKTTYLRNEITNFLQKPNETFNEAWERFKDLLRQCPHHGFSELHQLDTFYNALNPNDQDALDSAAGGNFLDKIPRECLSIIESKSKVRYSRSRVTDVRANANAPPPLSSHLNSFDLQQIAASLEDKLDIRMNRFEKSLNDMKNSFITPTAPLKAVEENTVTQGKFEAYTTANDANMNNLQLKFDNFQKNQQDFQKKFEQKQDDFQNQMMNFMQNLYNNKPSSLSSLPSKIPNPKGEAKAITTRSADFVVLDFIADPRVPLILGRPFLSTAYAIINVYEREIIIRQNQQSLTIQCSDIPSVKKVEQINKIDFINAGGIDFESEEIEDFLNDDSILFGVEDSPFNMDEDIFFLESLLRDDPIPPHPIIPNQIKLPIKEPNHSLNMGYDHFITNLSTEPIKDNSLDFMIISNPLFDNDKINSDEINSHASNFDESTSNHDAEKSDYLDEFYRPFIHIYILEEERTKREHEDYINRMEMLFTINSCPYNPTNDNTNVESFSSFSFPIQESDSHQEEIDVVSVTNDVLPPRNDVSDEEVDVVDVLRDDNFIQNSEHEYSESEDSDFDNLPLPLPRPEPPDKEFDFEKEILVVRNVIVKFECINARVKFDIFNDENDVLSYFMFVIFAKEFSLLFAESEDTIFDPGISD
nr:hypothetical protein [Tanacetum cinerariifolium]